jgi:hypothetical protein
MAEAGATTVHLSQQNCSLPSTCLFDLFDLFVAMAPRVRTAAVIPLHVQHSFCVEFVQTNLGYHLESTKPFHVMARFTVLQKKFNTATVLLLSL